MTENTWASNMEAIQRAGAVAGLMLHPFATVEEMVNVVTDAVRGDPLAALVAPGVGRVLGALRRAPRAAPVLCGCCGGPVRRLRFSIVVAVPEAGDQSAWLAVAICRRCARTPQQLHKAGAAAFTRLWPGSRCVTIPPGVGGHA